LSYESELQKKDKQSSSVEVAQGKNNRSSTLQLVDNRPEAGRLQNLHTLADNRPSTQQARQLKSMTDNRPVQKMENKTGLPDSLKSGVESLSGMSMDHVKVHYNSPQPAQLNAHAYAQGSDIHVAPGQEQHLPHEAWHVVQQAQGRVKPTMQMKGGVPINDNLGLEHEADEMGQKAQVGQAVSINSNETSRTKDNCQYGQNAAIQLRSISYNNWQDNFGITPGALAATFSADDLAIENPGNTDERGNLAHETIQADLRNSGANAEFGVPGASKKNNGNIGFVDFEQNGSFYEIKPDAGVGTAKAEAQWYVNRAAAAGRNYVRGGAYEDKNYRLINGVDVPFKGLPHQAYLFLVTTGHGDGAVTYRWRVVHIPITPPSIPKDEKEPPPKKDEEKKDEGPPKGGGGSKSGPAPSKKQTTLTAFWGPPIKG